MPRPGTPGRGTVPYGRHPGRLEPAERVGDPVGPHVRVHARAERGHLAAHLGHPALEFGEALLCPGHRAPPVRSANHRSHPSALVASASAATSARPWPRPCAGQQVGSAPWSVTSTRTVSLPAWTLTVTCPPGRPEALCWMALVTSSLAISAASAAAAGSGKNPATHDRAALTDSGRPAKVRVQVMAEARAWVAEVLVMPHL